MLRIDHVTKKYGTTTVLDDVSFEIPEGEIFGFIGANGAGKTTTMRIIMGVLAMSSGEVRWDGKPLTREVRRSFGYMPEERGLYQKMALIDQVQYFGELYGMDRPAARREAESLLEQLGLANYRNSELQTLSLGNQQRAQLAVALIHRPQMLVLDEPFSGLDPMGVAALADLLEQRRSEGVPILFSSHQLDLVERVIDSVGIIDTGRLVISGTVAEVRARQGRFLRVGLADAADGWEERVPGQLVGRDDHTVQIDPNGVDVNDLLVALMREGTVEQFGWDEPRLVDVFREVAA